MKRFVAAGALSASFLLFQACIAPRQEPVLISPRGGETVQLLGGIQKEYLRLPREKRVKRFSDESYRKRMVKAGFFPKPVEFVWKSTSGGTNTLKIARSGEESLFFTTNIVAASGAKIRVTVSNFEIARDYVWSVTDGEGRFSSGTFATEDCAPRMIKLPNVPNVRDLGGRIGLDGRRVKQGMVFRSAGLNDNAAYIRYTAAELLEIPACASEIRSFHDESDKFRAKAKTQWNRNVLPLSLPGKWALFMPEATRNSFEEKAAPLLAGLNSIPDSFLCAPRSEINFEDGKTHFFDKASAKGPAVMMREIDSPRDGCLLATAGGDYWWNLRVNGEMAIDLLKAGNWRGPYTPFNYKFAVPLKKGRNLLVLTLFTGDATWSWGCASAPKLTFEEAIEEVASIPLHMAEDTAAGKIKETIAGANRLTAASMFYATNTLAIKTDIDLRTDGECWGMTGSPLGPAVKWVHISSAQYATMDTEWGKTQFSNVFKVFLDEKNYPIDFHCIAGQDRTGAVAFIVNGLLGVDEEELWRDWETTGFWNPSMRFNHAKFAGLTKVFDGYPGGTIRERIEAYVLSCGFTMSDIEKFREIMLER